jgi:hypothetical protein
MRRDEPVPESAMTSAAPFEHRDDLIALFADLGRELDEIDARAGDRHGRRISAAVAHLAGCNA